jgi:hypothetical protein
MTHYFFGLQIRMKGIYKASFECMKGIYKASFECMWYNPHFPVIKIKQKLKHIN